MHIKIKQKTKIITTSVSIFAGAFFCSFLAYSVFAPTSPSNADTLHFNFSASGYTTSVQSASTVSIDLETYPTATTATASDTVITNTNNPDGYKLYVFMDRSTDYSETNPGNALYKDGDTTSSTFIPATAGTLANPTALSMNTWGLSLDNGTSYGAVPLKSAPHLVASSDTATTSEGDTLNVQYGVSANMNLKSGTYTGNVVYEVIPDATTGSFDTSAVYPATAEPGETLTIVTDLYTSTALTSSDITVTVGEGAESYACTVNEVSTAAGNLVITCALPADAADGEDLPLTVTITPFSKTYNMTVTVMTPGPTCAPYTICYQPNGADVQGEMPNQTQVYLNSADNNYKTDTITSSTTEFTLYAPNFSRTGYGFAGWNTKADGTGTNYGPSETLQSNTLTDFGTKGLILYANWIASAGDIGSWSGCSSLAKGSVTALTDSRESGNPQTYAVAKLVDGKCWMIENMRYQGGGTSSNSWGTSTSASYFNYTNMDRSLTASPTDSNSTGAQWYSYGAYYSWPARTSVCPSGWSVPTANGSSTDFGYLYSLVGNASSFATSNNLRKYPNNFVSAGNWYQSSAYERGQTAYYWSATQNNSTNAYYLAFGPTYVAPADGRNKRYGFSIRCVRSS